MQEDNNKAPRTEAAPKEPKDSTQQGKKNSPNLFSLFVGGDFLQSKFVLRQGGLVLMIAVYCLVMVWNRYQVEDLTKSKIEAQDRINFLRETKIELQKRFQETIKISRIAEMLDSTGVGITAGPPYEI